MDRIDNLIFFVRITERGGVAAAGRDFGFSPATASERLARLEEYYGTKLINRTTRSISLTEEGKLLLENARHLIAEAEELESRIKFGVENISGLIRVSAPQDLGRRLIVPLIDNFMEQNRKVEIELVLDDRYIDLAATGVDIAIRLGSLTDSTLITRKLAPNRRTVVASKAYLAKHGMPKHPEDLASHNCLIMQNAYGLDHEWSFNIEGHNQVVRVSGNRNANSGAMIKKWCLENRGIALKSIWDVGDYIADGSLVELLQQFAPNADTALQLVYPSGREPTRRTRAMIEFFADAFRDKKQQYFGE